MLKASWARGVTCTGIGGAGSRPQRYINRPIDRIRKRIDIGSAVLLKDSDASPSNSMVPLSGRSNPLMQRSSVLFPEPLRPMIAATSPGSTVSDTASSA
jgi:hypothetical protein